MVAPPARHDLFSSRRNSATRIKQLGIITLVWGLCLVLVLNAKFTANLSQQSSTHPSQFTNDATAEVSLPPTPLNPFKDIKWKVTTKKSEEESYSSFHCVQADQSGYPDYQARTCEFSNIYYRPSDQTFHYYASSEEIMFYKNKTHDGIDALKDMCTVADGFLRWDNLVLGLESVSVDGEPFSYEWAPTIHTSVPPASNTAIASDERHHPVFVLYHPSYSFNFGHLIFDDLLSIYSMLEIFGHTGNHRPKATVPLFVERPARPLGLNFGSRDPFWRCHPSHADRWNMCRKLWTRVYPALMGVTPDPDTGDILRTGNFLRGAASIGEYDMAKAGRLEIDKGTHNVLPPHTDMVLLPRVVAGPGRLANWACKGECAIGRGAYLWGFRQYLFQNLFGTERGMALANQPPPTHGYITFSLPVGTTHADRVTMFEDMIPVAESRFGKARVRVVDMAKLPLTEQAQLVRSTAVYVTNHGGGSASGLFLPRDATAILFHGVGRLGEPKMLDRHFWNSLGYARVLWVHPEQHHEVDRAMAMIAHSIRTYEASHQQ